jgi:putative ABC transport system ATP-binding protein
VSIGRALVNNPVIIIADEPTGSLDEHLAEEIVEIYYPKYMDFINE